MATLTEKLVAFGEAQEQIKRDSPTSTIYPVRSGSKDIYAKWQIGGKALNIKKVARQPLQIFKGKEYLNNINKKRALIKTNIMPMTTLPKVFNRDTKPVMDTVMVNKVYGFEKLGGAGVPYAEGFIEKAEETKLMKMTYLDKDVE